MMSLVKLPDYLGGTSLGGNRQSMLSVVKTDFGFG
jgi:hypothetical protein